MIKGFRTFAVVMACVLSLSGYARPGQGNGNGPGNGNGNGNGNGRGNRPNSAETTFTVGQVSNSDDRILDVSGLYEFLDSTTTDTINTSATRLSIELTQDSRGRVKSSGTLTLSDGSTYQIAPHGHLQLTGQNGGTLRIQLTGGPSPANSFGDKAQAQLRGFWNGTSFDLAIKVLSSTAPAYTFNAELVPVNPARGFVIEDGPSMGNPKHKRSNRVVIFPWGEEMVRTQQRTKGSQLSFSAKGRSFGLDLRGSVDAAGTSINPSRVKVRVGYGVIHNSVDHTTALPAGTVAP